MRYHKVMLPRFLSKKDETESVKAMRELHMEKTEKQRKHEKVKAVPKSRWVKDIRAGGNLFCLEASLIFTANLCTRFKGTLDDRDAFAPVALMMRREKLLAVFYACTTANVRKDMKGRDYDRIDDPENEGSTSLLIALWRHPQSNPKFRQQLSSWLSLALERLAAWQATQPDPTKSRFEDLKRLFSLSDMEFDMLVVAAAVEKNGVWPCADFCGTISSEKITKMAAMHGVTESEYLAMIKPKAKLRRYGCLDDEGDLDSDLRPYIIGVDDTPLVSRYFKKSAAEVLPWDFFGELAERHGAFLKRLIAVQTPERGLNILLYGEPGTGKTSFALALAAELGRTPYLIVQSDDQQKGKEKAFRFSALQVCDGQVDPTRSLIVIDEADEMLSGGDGGFFRMMSDDSGTSGGKGLLIGVCRPDWFCP